MISCGKVVISSICKTKENKHDCVVKNSCCNVVRLLISNESLTVTILRKSEFNSEQTAQKSKLRE